MSTSKARPTLARQDISSDNLLSYYSSPLADNPLSPPIPISRQSSTDRDSNSDYSSFSYKSDTASDYSNQEESAGPASVTRRTSKSSKGAADRRRLAIVQVLDSKSQPMDSTESSSSSSQSDLRTRRGGQGGLALVAPPDVSPAVYMSEDTPVPPFTAPPDALHHDSPHSESFTARRKHETSPVTKYQHPQGHQRSASEITTGKRDIAIIGTLSSSSSHSRSSTSFIPPSFDSKTKARSLTLESSAPNTNIETSERALHPPPLFVRPQSRSPSPGAQSVSSISDLPVTPDIGEGKAIDVPVASPIVVMTNVDLRLPTASTFTSTRPTLKHAANSTRHPQSNTSSFSTSNSSSLSTTSIPHSSHSTTSSINIPTTTATTTTATASSPVIIPPSAHQTPQKQKTTPSIVVVPNTPKSPTTSHTPYTPKSAKTMMSLTPSSSSFSPNDLASYKHYMPGVHSTAGPLPPPPRASFIVNNGPGGSTPPPRPPRQVRSPSPTKTAAGRSLSPTKGITTTVQERERGRQSKEDKDKDMREALKLSPEVTAVLTSRLAPVTKVKSGSSSDADGKNTNATARTDQHDRSVMPTSAAAISTANSSSANAAETQSPAVVTKSVHMREGAFAPSTIISPMTTTPSTSSSSSTTPSNYPDANSPPLPTHTTQTLPERRRRRKVASSSSYEEYTLEETPEEEDGAESEYDTCGRKVHESTPDVAVAITSSQPVIKPPPRNQSLSATNAMGISGLPVEDEGWILADNVSGGAVSYGKRSLDGIPKTPSRDRDKVPERHSLDSPSSSYESEGPSPPPKSFRSSFTKGLKRLSLNAGSPRRSDSLSSRSAHSRTPSQASSTLPPLPDAEAGYNGRPSLSPSPSPNAFPPRPLSPLNPNSHSPNPSLPVPLPLGPSSLQNSPHPSYASYYTRPHPHAHKRIINTQPAALFCSELYSAPKKSSTSAERCAIYARKLNELYMYDCGLGDWIVGVGPGTGTRGPSNGVAVISFTDTPRKSSHGSTMSEATFPRRPDATLATDLMIPPTISSASSSGPLSPVSSAPPRLPYPSLLTKNNSGDKEKGGGGLLGSLTTPTSSGRGTGGFFASLGRKASMNRHRGASSDSGHSTTTKARLTKAPPNAGSAATVHGNTISSPVLVNTTQSVPGGPRALPGRAKTLMLSPSPSPNKEQFYGGSNSGSESGSGTLGRRPSLYNLGSSPSIESPQGMVRSEQRRDREKENDPMFSSQVNRLADLLPHVEKDILAGYLRRAGQDILAIGQYLDDEKNGRVRRD